ncbi:rhoptry-associated protein 1 [Hepatocystis sp. ex Piliocolobus tephrosceles]|nr:rhoptry-associated protein 1 [Hepatocystis sp. ex Piliocolobus tephrosceles]
MVTYFGYLVPIFYLLLCIITKSLKTNGEYLGNNYFENVNRFVKHGSFVDQVYLEDPKDSFYMSPSFIKLKHKTDKNDADGEEAGTNKTKETNENENKSTVNISANGQETVRQNPRSQTKRHSNGNTDPSILSSPYSVMSSRDSNLSDEGKLDNIDDLDDKTEGGAVIKPSENTEQNELGKKTESNVSYTVQTQSPVTGANTETNEKNNTNGTSNGSDSSSDNILHVMDARMNDIRLLNLERLKVKAKDEQMLNKEEEDISSKRNEERNYIERHNEKYRQSLNSGTTEATSEPKKESKTKILDLKEKSNDKSESKDETSIKNVNKGSSFFSRFNIFKKKLSPIKKEISTIKYTPELVSYADKILKGIGITHKYEPYQVVPLYNCPQNNFMYDDIGKLMNEMPILKLKNVTKENMKDNDICLNQYGLNDGVLENNKLSFGTTIGTIGIYHVRFFDVKHDLIKYMNELDYITLADDFKLATPENAYLSKINFCLLDPKNLQDFLKKPDIVKLMENDPEGYEAKFDAYMTESIKCHIESLIYDYVKSSQDNKVIFQTVSSKLYLLKNGLDYKSRRIVDRVFRNMKTETDKIINKLLWLHDNITVMTNDLVYYPYKSVCTKFVSNNNIFNAMSVLNMYISEYLTYYSSCIKNVTIYNSVVSGIHKEIKKLLKLMPRRNILTDIHFQVLFQKNNKNKDIIKVGDMEYDYDPTVKVFALKMVETQPMVSVINAYFEANKKLLSAKLAQMKLDLFTLLNQDMKLPDNKTKNSKLAANIINKYKSEIKKHFNKMRDEYAELIKMRYLGHLNRNYLLYKRLY